MKNVSRETTGPKALLFLIRARSDFQIPTPENATTPNARLNLCRKASTTASVRQTLSAHVSTARRRPREVGFILRLVRSESEQARGDRPIYRLQNRASQRRLLFPQITPENPKQNSPRPQSFLIHNHSFPPPHSFIFQNPLDIPSLLCYTVPRTNAGVLIAETPSGDFTVSGGEPFT